MLAALLPRAVGVDEVVIDIVDGSVETNVDEVVAALLDADIEGPCKGDGLFEFVIAETVNLVLPLRTLVFKAL